MGDLFPVDLTSLFMDAIQADKRPPDGKLHASSDLIGSLRHAQLRAIGTPTRSATIASQIRLMTGTLWHRWLEALLHDTGIEVHTEVKLDEWMPEGWSGTADYVFKHPDGVYSLGDLKTTKGESMFFINRDGAKQEHIWQLSSYFWALVESGIPMLNGVGVLYVPMNDIQSGETPAPSLQEITPIPKDVIIPHMEERATSVRELRAGIASEGYHFDSDGLLEEFQVPGGVHNPKLLETLTSLLAPEQERLQRITWDSKRELHNVVLVPHWSAAFCDWDAPLCDCRNQGTTKIGHYDLEGTYTPRKGYEGVEPTVSPSHRDGVKPSRKDIYERQARKT